MELDPKHGEWAIRILIYLLGIASTVVGSLIVSNIRIYQDNRKLHHDELKQKVLVPIRDALISAYRSLVLHQEPVIQEGWAAGSVRQATSVTEPPTVHGPVLKVADPREAVMASLDEVFLEDARQNHYAKLLCEWWEFTEAWSGHAQRCERWASKLAGQVLERSGLTAFPSPSPGPYVMHISLACYVYFWLFGLQVSALQKVKSDRDWWLQGTATLAVGAEEDIDKLIGILDGILKVESEASLALRGESEGLRSKLEALNRQLGLAIAEKRLRGRCSLVTLF